MTSPRALSGGAAAPAMPRPGRAGFLRSAPSFADTAPAPWRALVSEINGGRTPDGEPGIRDVDAPCDEFEPVGAPWEQSEGGGSCDTDGHYICSECVHISLSAVRGRRDLCRDCGAPLDRNGCSAHCDLPRLPVLEVDR